jgi:hypothetical protein
MVMRLAIIGSGIIPTAIVVLLVLSVFNRLRRRRIRPALYGRTGWAGREEMHRRGISRSRAL